MPLRKMTRRSVLQAAALSAGGVALGRLPAFAQSPETLRETPNVTLGPFYPLAKPDDQDVDLTVVRGQAGVAAGDVFVVSGFVRNRRGEPVQGATIEVWQANTYGRYRHPSDHNTAAPLDPHFEGYAVVRTDAEGRYRFRTIKPGPYPAFDGDWVRAPHIHFDVRGAFDRKITQMYFPNEPLNSQDRIFQAVRRHEVLLASVSRLSLDAAAGAAGFSATWDIIVASG
jgi:protocatechuate 3,4-dioxygenase beta subunit